MAMSEAEIREGLAKLQPLIPWAHQIDLGHDIKTVSPEEGDFYRKAKGLNRLASLFPDVLRAHMRRKSTFSGLRCLDIGCGEGAHSIAMARDGAKEVIGLEGRMLYVDRARFVARALELPNLRFTLQDARQMNPTALGTFDFVLCSGLLHHLDKESFLKFTQSLYDVTGNTLFLFANVTSIWVEKKFKLKGTDPIEGKYAGALCREHEDNATRLEKLAKVRGSLDNTFSFWPREDALIQRFVDVGFKHIVKLYEPAFAETYVERVFRGIWILRREAP